MSDSLTTIANRLGSDKGTTTYCSHGYTRIYERLLGPVKGAPLRIAEIGLVHPRTRQAATTLTACPSLSMWAEFLPAADIVGFDILDFTALATDRIRVFQGDQGNREDLERFARHAGPFDIVIDDGSHASHHQQITLATLFPHLVPGGFYIVEDLHYQPAELEVADITPTREFLRGLRHRLSGMRTPLSQIEYTRLAREIRNIAFFDSMSALWPMQQLEDALAIMIRQGDHPHLPVTW